MAENMDFKSTVDELFKGMNGFISSKTVVGDPIHVGETTILPLMDVSFGVGAGASDKGKGPNTGGGLGGKMTPSAVLVVSGGATKLINVKGSDGVAKLIDMVPDLINKFTEKKKAGTQTAE